MAGIGDKVTLAWRDGFTVLALAFAVLSVSLRWVPRRREETVKRTLSQASGSWPVRSALLALVLHFAALSAVWAYVERIADNVGIDAASIGSALALSLSMGVATARAVSV